MTTQSIRRWHRYFGVAAFLAVILLSVTGLLLNHTDDLKLDKTPIHQAWLNDWYGIELPEIEHGVSVQNQWFIQVGHQVYFNQKPLAEGRLINVVPAPFGFLVALTHRAILLSDQGELVDWVAYPDQNTLQRLFTTDNAILFQMTDQSLWQVNNDWSQLHTTYLTPPTHQTSPLKAVPESLHQPLQAALNRQGLSLERLLLDLHSGRFFGTYGHWVMDAFAILLILISLSGLWLYLNALHKQTKRK